MPYSYKIYQRKQKYYYFVSLNTHILGDPLYMAVCFWYLTKLTCPVYATVQERKPASLFSRY